jgi:hypothetical protein
MMESIWNPLFFTSKWLFVGLLYLFLFLVMAVVWKEMRQQIGKAGDRKDGPAAPGRLRVIQSGSDPNLTTGMLLTLKHQFALGAATDNDLVLADEFVSARHTRLRWDGAGWWLEDLGSRNGTLVNGRIIAPHTPHPTPFGARITIGDVEFELLS